jgi:23S rRNA pseudouridine1911/1915/1917 synthase
MARNDGFTYRERLPREAEHETLIAYLCRRYGHSTQSEWAARIDAGHVLVDARPAAPEVALRSGQELIWHRPSWDEPDAPLTFAVIYEDDDLLAVAKPAGLPTLPGAGFFQSTLLHQVRRYAPNATAIHRLGRWTSGVVLFARHRAARAELSRQLRVQAVRKRYRALAGGDPPWDGLTIDRPIGPVPHAALGSVHGAEAGGKPSVSRVEVLERRSSSFLCDVTIATGRPHQIRIHLAAAGHPLVGDPLYVAGGVPAADNRALPGDPGYLLHAVEAALRHPRTGEELVVSCPPPPALSMTERSATASRPCSESCAPGIPNP